MGPLAGVFELKNDVLQFTAAPKVEAPAAVDTPAAR
jgi:hypothetical protein